MRRRSGGRGHDVSPASVPAIPDTAGTEASVTGQEARSTRRLGKNAARNAAGLAELEPDAPGKDGPCGVATEFVTYYVTNSERQRAGQGGRAYGWATARTGPVEPRTIRRGGTRRE